jgi:hypothetical protein
LQHLKFAVFCLLETENLWESFVVRFRFRVLFESFTGFRPAKTSPRLFQFFANVFASKYQFAKFTNKLENGLAPQKIQKTEGSTHVYAVAFRLERLLLAAQVVSADVREVYVRESERARHFPPRHFFRVQQKFVVERTTQVL